MQANPRLAFGEAADRWLAEQVPSLRRQTRNGYTLAIERHLRPRFGGRRLDRISVDDWARLVVDLRASGLAESTIEGILRVGRRVYKFAARRMGWHGLHTVALLESSERPRVTAARKHRVFTVEELAQTLAAAHEPYRTLFSFAAATGARVSECLGLVWDDLDLTNLEEAVVSIEFQVDREGVRQELKTEASQREVELAPSLAALLLSHRDRCRLTGPEDFVFCTESGRAVNQRNVSRELRRAQRKAIDDEGQPTFPVLHARGADGKRLPVPRGSVPCFHSFRHTCASWAIADGDGAEEVSWQLGHKDSIVTRKVYVSEVRSVERTARRRSRMEQRYGGLFEGALTGARSPCGSRSADAGRRGPAVASGSGSGFEVISSQDLRPRRCKLAPQPLVR
ncbi:MAG: tyrosine-type recombinase/integrase [Actinobacteria bacterium]|nr:tyrosine-type recombinase/integrase [Actinomycetota bacterium]